MGRKKYEERLVKIRVPKGAKLTPSKKVPGALSPLVHAKKGGVREQAVVIPLTARDRSRGFLGSLLAFSLKALATLLVIGLLLVLIAVLLSAILDGAVAGLDTLAQTVSAASAQLVVIAAVVAVLAVVVGVFRVSRSRARRRHREREASRAVTVMQPVAQPVPAMVSAPAAAPAQWYSDPWDASRYRYWDGREWTGHVSPKYVEAAPAMAPGLPQRASAQYSRSADEARTTMSRTEWQNLVRAWVAASGAEQVLWDRIVHARISDADQETLDAQLQMEQLTHELGAQKVRLMIEANPRAYDELPIRDVLVRLLAATSARTTESRRIEQSMDRRGDARGTWLL